MDKDTKATIIGIAASYALLTLIVGAAIGVVVLISSVSNGGSI